MARTKRSPASLPVALELLATDHRKVEALFDRYDGDKDAGEGSRRDLARRICNELTAHTRLEEELFYPWLRENLGEMDLLEEALVEHASAKDLIAQLEGETDVDDAYDAKVKVLGEYVRHHVQEEENEIFPRVAGQKDALDELGQEMHARKAELIEELGLPEADDEAGMGRMPMRGRRNPPRQHAERRSH